MAARRLSQTSASSPAARRSLLMSANSSCSAWAGSMVVGVVLVVRRHVDRRVHPAEQGEVGQHQRARGVGGHHLDLVAAIAEAAAQFGVEASAPQAHGQRPDIAARHRDHQLRLGELAQESPGDGHALPRGGLARQRRQLQVLLPQQHDRGQLLGPLVVAHAHPVPAPAVRLGEHPGQRPPEVLEGARPIRRAAQREDQRVGVDDAVVAGQEPDRLGGRRPRGARHQRDVVGQGVVAIVGHGRLDAGGAGQIPRHLHQRPAELVQTVAIGAPAAGGALRLLLAPRGPIGHQRRGQVVRSPGPAGGVGGGRLPRRRRHPLLDPAQPGARRRGGGAVVTGQAQTGAGDRQRRQHEQGTAGTHRRKAR